MTRQEAIREVVSRARQAVREFSSDEGKEMKILEEAFEVLGLKEEE